MKPYGSKRSFDTEPRMNSGRALVKREGEAEIVEAWEEELARATDEKPACDCEICSR